MGWARRRTLRGSGMRGGVRGGRRSSGGRPDIHVGEVSCRSQIALSCAGCTNPLPSRTEAKPPSHTAIWINILKTIGDRSIMTAATMSIGSVPGRRSSVYFTAHGVVRSCQPQSAMLGLTLLKHLGLTRGMTKCRRSFSPTLGGKRRSRRPEHPLFAESRRRKRGDFIRAAPPPIAAPRSRGRGCGRPVRHAPAPAPAPRPRGDAPAGGSSSAAARA